MSRPLLFTPFSIHYLVIAVQFDAVYSEILTVLLCHYKLTNVFSIAPCLRTDPELLYGPVKLAHFPFPLRKKVLTFLGQGVFSFYERDYGVHLFIRLFTG
jgi:hypothetical protein